MFEWVNFISIEKNWLIHSYTELLAELYIHLKKFKYFLCNHTFKKFWGNVPSFPTCNSSILFKGCAFRQSYSALKKMWLLGYLLNFYFIFRSVSGPLAYKFPNMIAIVEWCKLSIAYVFSLAKKIQQNDFKLCYENCPSRRVMIFDVFFFLIIVNYTEQQPQMCFYTLWILPILALFFSLQFALSNWELVKFILKKILILELWGGWSRLTNSFNGRVVPNLANLSTR